MCWRTSFRPSLQKYTILIDADSKTGRNVAPHSALIGFFNSQKMTWGPTVLYCSMLLPTGAPI